MRFLTISAVVLASTISTVAYGQTAGADGSPSCDITNALAAAQTAPAKVVVNGVTLSPTVPPIIINDRIWIEAASLLGALQWSVSWDGALQRVTAQRDDFVMKLTLGNRTVLREARGYFANQAGYTPPDFRLDAGMTPCSSVPFSKTLIPLAAVADLTGSEVTWNNTTRTATVTRGTPYFYDRKADGTGADIMFTNMRYVGPGGSTVCASGSSFDWKSRYCVDSAGFATGNFPELYRARARELGIAEANTNRWPLSRLLEVIDSAGARGRSTAEVIAEMQSHTEIFGLPYDNHDISTPGMFSTTGGNQKDFVRSEAVLPPFVMSGRRQTDQMVRTLYAMMPADIRGSTAFLLPDRVAQNPEAYLPYIRSKQRAVLIGSFKGARSITSSADTLYPALMTRHQRELFKLRTTLALLSSVNVPVVDVLYGMGDSKTTFANDIRTELQNRMNRMLTAAGFANLVANNASRLTWGADELPAIAFAKSLPSYKVYVYTSNPNALHSWDAMASTSAVVDEKLASINVTRVNTPAEADMEIYVLNREPGIGSKIATAAISPDVCTAPKAGDTQIACKLVSTGASCTPGNTDCRRVYTDDSRFNDRAYIGDRANWSADNSAQASHDLAFVSLLAQIPAARRARSMIIDARVPNGAWNKVGAPTSTEWLIYSAWGTFANNIGLAIAQGKVLHHARAASLPVNVAANSRRMLLEAVAHDVFANGYFEGQRDSFETTHQSFRERLTAAGVTFVHQMGYSANDTHTVFSTLNAHVNEKMRAQFSLPVGTKLHVSAQFWRTFESEVHLYPVTAGEILTPGWYRTGTIPGTSKNMAEVLSPVFPATATDAITKVTLGSLIGTEAGVR